MSLRHPWDDAAQEGSPGMPSGTPQLLAFERLLADLTATFVNLPADRVDAEIDRGLKEITEFVDVDRTTLLEFSLDGGLLRRGHWYARPGIKPKSDIIATAEYLWYLSQLRQGGDAGVVSTAG